MTILRKGLPAIFILVFAVSAPAFANSAIEPVDTFALQVSNRIGILKYCKAKGLASDADVVNAQTVLANDPQKPTPERLAEAERQGSLGNILAGDTYLGMAVLNRQSGFSVKETCEGVIAAAQMAAKP